MTRKKKILIFSFAYAPLVGGAEIAVKEITDRLGSRFAFDMVTLRFSKEHASKEKIGEVTVYRIGGVWGGIGKFIYPFQAARLARTLHRDDQYHAIWSIMANYAGFGALFFKMLYPRVPFILTLQEGDPIRYILRRVRFVYPLFKLIFKKAEVTQAISHYLADFGRSMGALPVHIVPNGVTTEYFSKEPHWSEKEVIRDALNKSEGDVFLVTTSRLVEKNAVVDVIRALPFLPYHIKFIVIGEGAQKSMLKQTAAQLEVSSRVQFLGNIEHRFLPAYLNACDIFIRPSLSEGMGNSFIEAMAAGLPVIATPVGGIVDFLYDPEANPEQKSTGLFVKVHDPEDIARAVRRYLEDSALRFEIINNARALVAERYHWNTIARRMADEIFEPVMTR